MSTHVVPERPVVALVATPKFKERHNGELRRFAYEHLYTLASHFDVISTGRTYGEIKSFVNLDLEQIRRSEGGALIEMDLGEQLTEISVEKWRDPIRKHFRPKNVGVKGMIEIANELVQGRVEAVIQFSVEDDTTVRAGSAALRREANVHNIPIASDIWTANAFLKYWKGKLRRLGPNGSAWSLFRPRTEKNDHCAKLRGSVGDVLALIAHNGQKPAMKRFVTDHAQELRQFRYILATGHTGLDVRKCLRGKGWSKKETLDRILLCNSGPEGGDVEIAAAVIQGLCRHIFFFQDPANSHPHEADIRLFEQAILDGTDVRMAPNPESAKILLASF